MKKYDKRVLGRVEENIERVKDYIAKLSEIQSTDKTVFWNAIKAIITKQKKGHTEKLIATLKEKNIDHPGTVLAEVKFIGGYLACYDEVLGLVDGNQELIDEATSRIIELKKQLKEIEDNIETQ